MTTVNAKLAVGPMSKEIIEATFQFSDMHTFPIMLIASKNQIDFDGGYVQDWTTRQYSLFIDKMIETYPRNHVYLCRDHCGVGFRDKQPDTLKEVYKTIDADLAHDFDLIHIDLCNFSGDHDIKIKQTKKLMEYALKNTKTIMFEVGTDVNTGTVKVDVDRIRRELNEFCDISKPEFYVHQTGSLVKETLQVGDFHKGQVEKVHKILDEFGVKLKEHNADYLDGKSIRERKGLVDAMNIAPQLGAIQTQLVLGEALVYGIDTEEFQEVVYKGKKWSKWMRKDNVPDKLYASFIAGHYHYSSKEWKDLVSKLKDCTDIEGIVVEQIQQVLNHYRKNLCK